MPVRALAVLLLGLLAACGDGSASGDPASQSGTGPTSSSTGAAPGATGAAPASLAFTDVTATSGLVLENVSGDPLRKLAIVENIGQGGAALDYDGDGDLDLYVANGTVFEGQTPRATPRPALYRNDGELRFTDVTEEAGLLALDVWMHGAWVVDFDADGDPDIYVSVYNAPNLFYRNDGGRFVEASDQWGGADPGASSACAFFDAEGDGDLDLYVGGYVDYDPKNPPNEGLPCDWKGLEVSCGPRGTPPAADRFYENVEGRLVEATAKFGFEKAPAFTLAVVAADVNGDGHVDVFVSNDSVDNYHFVNDGKGRFAEEGQFLETAVSGRGHPQAGMGADFGDIDRDGRLDLYVTHFSHDFNTLYKNESTADGRTMFFDATDVLGLKAPTMPYLSWGTAIVDLDRNGWRDLVIASGHVYPQVDGAGLDTSYAQRNQVFLNRGRKEEDRWGRFEEWMPPKGDGLAKLAVSRGLVTADLDDDGDLDLFFIEMDAPPTLLRNDLEGGGAWIGFTLQGPGKNRDAIGAKVTVIDSAGVVRVDQRTSGESYFSTPDPRLFFGLGGASGPVSVSVLWPDGTQSEFDGLAPGSYHLLSSTAGGR